jgi:hypothetical protein
MAPAEAREFVSSSDSLLEGDGSEPSVLRRERKVCSERKRLPAGSSRDVLTGRSGA